MKKLILIFITFFLCVAAYCQTSYKDITIYKSTPKIYFIGTGPVIDFNSAITLTQTSGVLTLAGGNLAIGSNSITGTGSIGATGGRFTKGWFTNLEITNLPTVNGGTLKSALSLTASDVNLGNVTNESKSTMFNGPTFTGIVGGNLTLVNPLRGNVRTDSLTYTSADTLSLPDALPLLNGIKLKQLTTSEINALTPTEGQVVYDKTLHVMKFYNGTTWKTITTD
jgi:hypothetical protein